MNIEKIRLTNVSKTYRKFNSEWKRIASWLNFSVRPSTEIAVLKNISFTIGAGEAVGIIGQNGAGKSTLLKMITGTLLPSNGRITVNGRISAILELGMGFNSNLTGRENAYHSAGLMGFTHDQIVKIIPEILEFSELGDYFDQPLRIYSSGMGARLAFSVVTAIRPDILIVDEVLSVGDTYFQHKSFSRIRQFQKEGTTLLIVSHDGSAIQSICNRAILLEKGVLVKEGDPESVLDFYNALIAEKEHETVSLNNHQSGKIQTISGTGDATIADIGLYDNHGQRIEYVQVGQNVEIHIQVHIHKDIPRLVFGYVIKDRLGQIIFGTNTHYTEQILENVVVGNKIEIKLKFQANLGPGTYSVSTALHSSDTHLENNYQWMDLALVFTVTNVNKTYFIGYNWIPPKITVETL